MLKNEHIFNVSREELYDCLLTTLKEEVKVITNKEFDNLEGIKYEQERPSGVLYYTVEKCNIKDGYKVNIKETNFSNYILEIKFESIDDTHTKMIYINEYHSSKMSRRLNYKVMSFLFKRKIRNKYLGFIMYVENKLNETKEK